MRKIEFTFRGGGINSRVTETIEVEDSTTNEEIDEMLSQWLWERSDATWSEVNFE